MTGSNVLYEFRGAVYPAHVGVKLLNGWTVSKVDGYLVSVSSGKRTWTEPISGGFVPAGDGPCCQRTTAFAGRPWRTSAVGHDAGNGGKSSGEIGMGMFSGMDDEPSSRGLFARLRGWRVSFTESTPVALMPIAGVEPGFTSTNSATRPRNAVAERIAGQPMTLGMRLRMGDVTDVEASDAADAVEQRRGPVGCG